MLYLYIINVIYLVPNTAVKKKILIIKSRGPEMLPCGTPVWILRGLDNAPFAETTRFLLDRYLYAKLCMRTLGLNVQGQGKPVVGHPMEHHFSAVCTKYTDACFSSREYLHYHSTSDGR